MVKKIKTVYVVHHSHTDIGYTDLQERIIIAQANYIRTVLKMMKDSKNSSFRWNCETYYCVEKFFEIATEEEKKEFFDHVFAGKIGISGSYLNFTDLLDSTIYKQRLTEMISLFRQHGTIVKTAMFADINGISMGQRNAMIENGVEFLYTNIHCHHGMYPLYQNQNAYFWENNEGKRILVWNGEHYHLGNMLGIKYDEEDFELNSDSLKQESILNKAVENMHKKLVDYLELCEKYDYKYNFIITSVSGVYSDNAPPDLSILEMINQHNQIYGDEVQLKMVSLQELYEAIKEELKDSPVYHGDLTDWWANGVGSTPYAVKHYKDAVRLYHLCERLDSNVNKKYSQLRRGAQDNLMLYAEHTWGHSSTVSNPYETMVLNLDMRKSSYASRAHESSAIVLTKIDEELGDILRYYNKSGKIKVINTTDICAKMPVEFYLETNMKNAGVTDCNTGKIVTCQTSGHPRGILIRFTDEFLPREIKEYNYYEVPEETSIENSRVAYIGRERVKDIINNFDTSAFSLPYEFKNKWFYLSYEPEIGIKEFKNIQTGKSLLREGDIPFFTPIYEETKIVSDKSDWGLPDLEERRKLGRNIRGIHAKQYSGKLKEILCREQGNVCTVLEFVFELPGTSHASVIAHFYEDLPRVDYKLQIAKNNSNNIESIYMPMTLTLGEEALYLKKGEEAFRPGVDQIPGTCMEYYMTDNGVAFIGKEQSIIIESRDVSLTAMGQLKHHPILLCDCNVENNKRPIYSWIMNNTWETNFKIDLGGYCEFCYSLTLTDEVNPERVFHQLEEQSFGTYPLITG